MIPSSFWKQSTVQSRGSMRAKTFLAVSSGISQRYRTSPVFRSRTLAPFIKMKYRRKGRSRRKGGMAPSSRPVARTTWHPPAAARSRAARLAGDRLLSSRRRVPSRSVSISFGFMNIFLFTSDRGARCAPRFLKILPRRTPPALTPCFGPGPTGWTTGRQTAAADCPCSPPPAWRRWGESGPLPSERGRPRPL